MSDAFDKKELEAAKIAAEESSDTFNIQLKRPVEYNGQTFNSLTFDFGTLTGEDGLSIENELQALGKIAMVPAFSGEYLIRMAAKACTEKIGSDIFMKLSLQDYNRVRSAARSFLLKSE